MGLNVCRGVVFGTIYGGIIFPPAQAVYFPAPIVSVVVFGPVFAQSVFIGPSGSPYFCDTAFYAPGGRRIYNPCESCIPAAPATAMLCMVIHGTVDYGSAFDCIFCMTAAHLLY